MATQQQSFNHFLNAGGPSTPRGRGRGGGGRGRGSGRGGRGGSSSAGGSNVKKSDYSNVPFDYASINSQRYNKMDGFVQPFGPSDSPSNRGSPHPRGRGRGRGGLGTNATPASPRVDSGSSTPVRGIGHRGRGAGLGSDRPSSGYKGKSTVGREGVTWGGRGAPIFVKSGELFKDGEVDIIRKDEDDEITVETVPLSDPSAPQMTDLKDDTEIEIMQTEPIPEAADIAEPDEDRTIVPSPVPQISDLVVETIQTEVDVDMMTEDEPIESTSPAIEGAAPQLVNETTETMTVNVAESPALPQAPAPPVIAEIEAELDSMFFVDTEPALVEEDPFYIDTQPGNASSSGTKPKYHASSSQALGHREATVSSDEEIVFAPKTYKQPQPINVDMSQASGSRPSRTTAPEPKRPIAVAPKISRAQKKAAKKEKKKGGSKKSKRFQRQPELVDGSDIEWGSDGPPRRAEIMGLEGVDESDGEDDVAVLRDYLEGTLLNAKTGSADEMDDDQELGSDEVDEAIDIEMMRQFGAGVKQWNNDGSAGSGSGDDSDGQEGSDSEEDDDSHMEDASESDSDDEEDTIDVDALEAEVAAEQDIDRQLAIALEKGEEDSDIEELFTGKSGWGDETDWFLQSMTDALDPKAVSYKNRKSNSKLFHAIENGNFDDFDLSVEPSKKKKNNKHVPAELQVQWNKDREAKAEKKRQRAMDRLLVELDPYPSARKRKNKGKGKEVAQAASMAHLIPASAAEVAEMFDISSGEDEDSPGTWKNKRQGLLPDITETWMSQVNSQVQEFLQDAGKTTFSLPPMAKDGRVKIHMLAECYGLASKSKGGGRGRFTILYKNTKSGQSVDYAQVDRLVKASQAPGGLFYKSYFGGKKANGNPNKFDKSGKVKKTGKTTTAHGNGNMPSLRARDGEEVGGGAERIGMDNVGHRLLSRMGWADGDRIGKSGGLEAPIMAIVKNTKSGLGA